MTKQEVKNNIERDIRVKTAVNSITPNNVGKNMKDIVDLIPDPTLPIGKPYREFIAQAQITKTTVKLYILQNELTFQIPTCTYTDGGLGITFPDMTANDEHFHFINVTISPDYADDWNSRHVSASDRSRGLNITITDKDGQKLKQSNISNTVKIYIEIRDYAIRS